MKAFSIPQAVGRPRSRPRAAACDKAYSIPRVRRWLRQHSIRPVIPHKDNERAKQDGRVHFDRPAYRRRSVIEQCVGWLKESRRVGTRFDKLAVNFHAFVSLAMTARYLRILFRDRA